MSFTLTNILTDLSYLLGESSVPTEGIEDRKNFIQRSLEEAHRWGDWEWAKKTATVQLTAGVGTLPVDLQISPNLDVRLIQVGQGADHIFELIPYEQQDAYGDGDYKYWITGGLGTYTLNTSESSDSTSLLTVRYDITPPDLLNSGTTDFPSSQTLAKGALRYVRSSQDPEYDVSQDEAIFQKGLTDIWADQNSARPRQKAKTAQDRVGYYTGDI